MASYRLIWRGAMLFLLTALLLYAANFLYHSFQFARARGEVNYAESTWLFAALRVRHGLTPYFDYTQAPYIPMAYAPLLPGLAGWIGALFGFSDRQTITLTRLFSPASALASSGVIALICRVLRVSRLHSIIAGLLFLTPQLTFSLWSLAARSDMLAVAVGMAAIAIPVIGLRRGGLPTWVLFCGGLVCGLAIAAKQSAVAPLLALVLWVFFGGAGNNSWKGRVGQASLVVVAALAGFAGVIAPFGMDGARQLLQGTMDLATHPQSAADLYTRLDELVRMFGLCFPLSVIGIWKLVPARTPGEVPTESVNAARLLLTYMLTSTTVFLVIAAKVGSASSYALEVVAVLCVTAGIGLGELHGLFAKAERQIAMALFLLAIVPLATQSWYAIKTAQSTQEGGPNDEALAALAQVDQGPVLSENGYILLKGPTPPYLLDPLFFSVQESLGEWDAAPLVKLVEEKKFISVVLFHTVASRPTVNGIGWLPDGLYDALERNYELAGVRGRFNVYKPKGP